MKYKIKKKRIEKGLSIEELAFKSGISMQTVRNLEDKNVNTSLNTLMAIAKVLKCNVKDLF